MVNKAIKFGGLWEAQVAECRPHLHPGRDKAQCCHMWRPASVKKEELCEKPPLKEVGSMGAGVTKARDGATGGGRSGLQRQGQVQEGGKRAKERESGCRAGQKVRVIPDPLGSPAPSGLLHSLASSISFLNMINHHHWPCVRPMRIQEKARAVLPSVSSQLFWNVKWCSGSGEKSGSFSNC